MASTFDYAPADAAEAAKPSAYAWKLVWLLCFVALLNYLDRLMITTMRDPVRADLHVTDAQFALFTSVFLWTYAACSPLGGFFADRFGRRRVILASLLFWSVATVASERVGPYLGAALGGLGGFLADWQGWRFGFRLFGGIGIAYFFVLFFTLKDATATPERVETSTAIDDARPAFASIVATLLSVPGFWLLLLINILIGIVNWAVYGWLPTFLKVQFRLGNGAAGMSATAYIQVASFFGVIVAGVAADRWSRRNRRARNLIPGIGYLLAGPCLFAAASTPWLALAISGLIIFGLGRGAFDANQMPIVRELVDEKHSATAYGLLNFIGTTAGGIMVYAGGALLDAHVDLSRVFQFCGACLVAVSLILLLLPTAREPSDAATRSVHPDDSLALMPSDVSPLETQET